MPRDELQAAGRAGHAAQGLDRVADIAAGRHGKRQRAQRVGGLEAADQRQLDAVQLAQDLDRQMLAGRRRLVLEQAELAALGAVGPEADAAARQIATRAWARSLSALTTAVPLSGSRLSNSRALAAK